MRASCGLLGVIILSACLAVSCGEGNGNGGSGGTGGDGGSGAAGASGSGGVGGTGGMAGVGGTGGTEPACQGTVCACAEAGIRAAVAEGRGLFTFDCDGPATVRTEAEIIIENDVILDGEGTLTVDGGEDHRVFSVPEGVTSELRGLEVTHGATEEEGGGINNYGTVTLINSIVSGNSTSLAGGGVNNDGTLTLISSTVSGNNATASGGGILNRGTVTLTNSTVSENTASMGFGGGILNVGTVTLTNSTVSGNSAEASGGGILNSGTVTLTNSTVSGNTASMGFGGGIYANGTVTLTNSTVSENSAAARGGGIYNDGALMLTDCTVSKNMSSMGAGIWNLGALILANSTVSSNTSEELGGGIGNGSSIATLTLVNSTLFGNTAESGPGGGILMEAGAATLINDTISGNIAESGSGIAGGGGILSASNTLVADGCDARGLIMVSGGHNIESSGNGCGFDDPSDQVEVLPSALNLAPIVQDNGGPTETEALLPGSVAIDAIPPEDCVDADGQPLTTDQRGLPRPVGDGCDAGAFEKQP